MKAARRDIGVTKVTGGVGGGGGGAWTGVGGWRLGGGVYCNYAGVNW